MRRLLLLLVVAAVMTACRSGDASDPAATATQVRPTPAPVESITTSVPDRAGLCNGYLILVRSGDDGPLRAELDDPAMMEDLDAMLSSEGEFEAIARAAFELEEAVVARCAERFAAGVEPAADDVTALTRFMEAVIAGEEGAAADVAWANVVAQFDPWAPLPSSEASDLPSYTINGSTATARLDPATTVSCRAEDGVVVSCAYE